MDSAVGQALPMAEFRHVDVVFGKHSPQALALLDAGKTRQEILDATGAVLGAADGHDGVGSVRERDLAAQLAAGSRNRGHIAS